MICWFDGCEEPQQGHGLCATHHAFVFGSDALRLERRAEHPETERMCGEEGCEKKLFARGMCSMHYQRSYRQIGKTRREEQPPRPKLEWKAAHLCEWGHCQRVATVQLVYGRLENGRLCAGINYCDDHAANVRLMFHVERERRPDSSQAGRYGKQCTALNARGERCRRIRVPGEDTCPAHLAIAAAA